MAKVKLLQLVDLDGDNMGLVKTNIPAVAVKQHWELFVDEQSTDVNDFVEYLTNYYPENKIERVFVDIITP